MNPKLFSSVNKLPPLLWQAIALAISFSTFALILLNRSPNFLRPLSMALRTGFGIVIPATFLLLYLVFRIPGRVGDLLGITFTMSLFAMPLAGLWASGQTKSTVLNGLIPLYDAESYFIDALRLIDGLKFTIFSARRPLFSGLLSVLLSLTKSNLMASLAILTGLVGLACYFAAREIQRTHGAEAASFALIIVFLFYRAHSGVSMSENLGVAFGVLGFGLLWRGAANRNLGAIWLGLLTTTLGLNARAGAFFMLPLLILWAGWLLRENQFISWRALFISASAVVVGFVLSLSLTRLLAVPAGVPFANFSYTLYGLASGGKSWTYVFEAHPEVLAIQEPEQSKRIYQLAFDLIRAKPWQAVQGAFFNWKMLFSNTWYNVYSYVGGENWTVNVIAHWGMYLLGLLGIFAWFRQHNDPIQSLVMVSIVGIFVSVPFLPPTDAYRMRPYAASIIILGTLPALGLSYILQKTKLEFFNRPMGFETPSLMTGFSILLIMLTWLGPVIIKSTASTKVFTSARCTSGNDFILVRLDQGSAINIQKQNQSFLDWMPNFHVGLFQENAHALPDSYLIEWAQSIEPPKTIFLTLDYHSKAQAMVVAPTGLLPKPGTFVQICGKFETATQLAPFRIFYAHNVRILPQ